MFKRLMRWLRGTEPEPGPPKPLRQFHDWFVANPGCKRVAVPVAFYEDLVAAFAVREKYVQSYDNGVLLWGVEIFPDPSVTEFTSR